MENMQSTETWKTSGLRATEVMDRATKGKTAVECRTRNQVSPGSNPTLLPFRRLGIFVLSVDAPVPSAV